MRNLARAVCRVAVAVSERDASTLTRRDARRRFSGSPTSSRCRASDPSPEAADYFLAINTVPVADRPALGAPLEQLVAACVRRATLLRFHDVGQEAEDRDTFSRSENRSSRISSITATG